MTPLSCRPADRSVSAPEGSELARLLPGMETFLNVLNQFLRFRSTSPQPPVFCNAQAALRIHLGIAPPTHLARGTKLLILLSLFAQTLAFKPADPEERKHLMPY